MAQMTTIPKCQIHFYNPLKMAIFAISKDERLIELKLLKLEVRTALLTVLYT